MPDESGAIRQDRLVFPIPPGTHWRDIRPADVHALANAAGDAPPRALPGAEAQRKTVRRAPKAVVVAKQMQSAIAAGGLRFSAAVEPAVAKAPRARAARPAAVRIDPKLIAAARELRDRYLERANDGMTLPSPTGKYDVARQLSARQTQAPLLLAG